MTQDENQFLDALQNIEFALKTQYESNENLTDSKVTIALENATIDVKKAFGFAKKN